MNNQPAEVTGGKQIPKPGNPVQPSVNQTPDTGKQIQPSGKQIPKPGNPVQPSGITSTNKLKSKLNESNVTTKESKQMR